MKKLITAMALALTLGLPLAAQTHRHHSKKATVTATTDTDSASITVWSDTTSATSAATDSATASPTAASQTVKTFTFTDADDPFTLMAFLGTLGVGGVLIALFCVVFALLLLASPFIIVGLIIYWLIRRKRTEYKIVEKAVETGQPIPAGVLKNKAEDRKEIWRQGIKNTAIGLGIIIFGLFFDKFFVAVGAIVACWGVGKCVIARTSADGRRYEPEDDAYADLTRDGGDDGAEKTEL